jgi:MFS family permease|tara:strand:- start:530 stop:1843 length:1314 start_codon:yes stop_codon:yes gene_type:complete
MTERSSSKEELLELDPEAAAEALEAPRARWPQTFDAFRDRNFCWFFAALFGNFAAMNMQMFIRGWLVYEITGSYEKLGWMSAAGGIVGLVLAPLGGVVADRVRQKKHVVQFCQGINASITLTIAVLIAMGVLNFGHLLIASIVQGMSMNAMMPSRQALTAEIVGMERLTNAIALSTSGMNTARLLVPGLAGFIVAALGGGNGNIDPAQYVYYIMTILYVISMLGLIIVKIEDHEPEASGEPILEGLLQGFRYVFHTPIIRMLLGVNFLMVFFSMTYFLLLPGFVKDVLDAGPDRLGLIISISGIGSLVGSLLIASMPDRNRGRVLLSSALLLGLGLIFFASSTNYWLSVVILTVVGLGQSGRMSLSNVLLQANVDNDYRGRVMSVYMLEFSILAISIYPISLLADKVGPQIAVGISGAGLVVLVLALFKVPAYRDLD